MLPLHPSPFWHRVALSGMYHAWIPRSCWLQHPLATIPYFVEAHAGARWQRALSNHVN
jgi:hypothetical protein